MVKKPHATGREKNPTPTSNTRGIKKARARPRAGESPGDQKARQQRSTEIKQVWKLSITTAKEAKGLAGLRTAAQVEPMEIGDPNAVTWKGIDPTQVGQILRSTLDRQTREMSTKSKQQSCGLGEVTRQLANNTTAGDTAAQSHMC